MSELSQNQFEEKLDELGGKLEKFHDTLEQLTIWGGYVSSEPDIWEFKFNGEKKTLRVASDKLLNSKVFREEYIKVFKRPAPQLKGAAWDTLLELWAEQKEVKITDNPGQVVLDAMTLYESVLELPTKGNPTKNHCCYIPETHPDRRLVHSSQIAWILNRNNIFSSTKEDLNRVCIELGYKDNGYKSARWNGEKPASFWWFVNAEPKDHGSEVDA